MVAGRLLRPMGLTAVVSSDLRRARATAELIAAELPVPGPIGVYGALREYDLGAWSGLTHDEIEQRWPGAIEDWRQGRSCATPGGERRDLFVARISAALSRVAADHPDDTVLVITHGGVMGALVRSLGSSPRRFTHLCGLWMDVEGDSLALGDEVALLGPGLGLGRADTDRGEGTELSATAVGVIDTPAR